MTLLESVVGEWTNDQLRTAAASDLPILAAAAQTELDSRPSAQPKPADGEARIRAVFPARPAPALPDHGTGCSCCGAGVRQWR